MPSDTTNKEIYDHQSSTLRWMVGLFVSGVIAVTSATAYLDHRASALYASRVEVSELRKEVAMVTDIYARKEQKLAQLESKQTATLVQLAEIRARIDLLLSDRKGREDRGTNKSRRR